MSPEIRSLTIGLTALGLAWLGMAPRAGAGPPRPPIEAPQPAAPTGQMPAATPTVLLLSTGRVVQGQVLETDEGYMVRTPIGALPFRRRDVERTFGSIGEVYRYKLGRLPDQDPDEHLKLAQWCLEQKLAAEAREQLEAVLQLSPGHPQAQAMLFRLEAAAQPPTAPLADPGLMRTAGERVEPEPPAMLPSGALRQIREQNRRTPALAPVIFDLPAPLAVKKYREYAAYVHPALQRACAQCHNEQSDSSFQLIKAITRRDLENDLLVRTNLDAVLRLIDPRDPANSKLLTSAIMPHEPSGRPILSGPNHPTYRLLATWLQGMKSATATAAAMPASRTADPAGGVAPAVFAAPAGSGPPTGGGFAADRLGPGVGPAPTPAAPAPPPPPADPAPAASAEAPHTIQLSSGKVVPVEPGPAGQLLPGSANGPQVVPPPSEFPTPTLQGRPNPAPIVLGGQEPNRGATPTPAPAGPTTKVLQLPSGEEIPVVDTRGPAAKAPVLSAGRPGDDGTVPAPKKRTPKIDPGALQKFMSGGGPPKP